LRSGIEVGIGLEYGDRDGDVGIDVDRNVTAIKFAEGST